MGGASINKNLFVGGNIYFGETTSNSDSMYISRTNLTGNVSELACYIGDDATNIISTFPPTNESSATDYFNTRSTNTGNPQHSFSSNGNSYRGNSIYCTNNINGTLIPTNSGGSITGNNNYMVLNSPSNGGIIFNNSNIEMLRIYKNYSTNINYIGNGSGNNYIINTGYGSKISKSLHSSANYAYNYNIKYY